MAVARLHIPIDKAGRVVLPKPIRDRLGLTEGTEFEVIEEDDKIILKPVEPAARLVRKNGILVFVPEKSDPNLDIVEFIKKQREERIKKFIKV